MISAASSFLNFEEISSITDICQKYNINLTSMMFKNNAKENEDIIKTCINNHITITASVFQKKSK